MAKTKMRFRRAYQYRCKACQEKRETKVWHRFIGRVCLKCKRLGVPEGQEPLFVVPEESLDADGKIGVALNA